MKMLNLEKGNLEARTVAFGSVLHHGVLMIFKLEHHEATLNVPHAEDDLPAQDRLVIAKTVSIQDEDVVVELATVVAVVVIPVVVVM